MPERSPRSFASGAVEGPDSRDDSNPVLCRIPSLAQILHVGLKFFNQGIFLSRRQPFQLLFHAQSHYQEYESLKPD